MKIVEVNDSSALGSSNTEVFNVIEEVFTPGAQQLERSGPSASSSTQQTDYSLEESTPSTAKETPTADSKEDFTHTDHIKSEIVDKTSNSWHKVSIIETEEPDEYNTTIDCMKRVEIVEDEDNAISQSIIQDSDKLKKEGNNSLAAQRYKKILTSSLGKVEKPQADDSPHPTTVEKKKVRSYDAQALAF